ncbi:MAG: CoA transferase [Bosea sp.]|uniref:CaiB/BaiF CoA transferase family protein n=1 Tax=Bosea sp. (in: a-proteobacteria) TaxID=1871050 RepID=UPI001AD3AC96|nr:CoA transferase [Bosea sp. (in: a-proteobacteria)]MBN9472329.1 CoA transferase [Bosea sp. (in: a-proteobacteria)]
MPLTGLRIVDLTRVISGPFCTMLLADLGADVIKVEPSEGDPLRTQGSGRNGLSWYYASFNRNKRSVVLDLKTEEGKRGLEKLLVDADAVIDNFRPGVMQRLGFGEERLQQIRPGIITCSITGFGADGPYRDRPAFDFIAQAMSGFMSVNGGKEDPPQRSGLPISDLVCGIYGALGLCAALLGRERNGGAERVDVSLTNSMVSLLAYTASHYFATGEVLPRTGNDHPIASPYGLFKTRDGQIAIAPSDNVFFGRLMDALDLPKVKNDPDFADNFRRVEHRDRLRELVEERLSERDSTDWIERLNAAGVPCGPIYDLKGVFSDPQIASQKMAIDVPTAAHDTVRMLGFPIKLKERACQVRRPPPQLGEHTVELLNPGTELSVRRQGP